MTIHGSKFIVRPLIVGVAMFLVGLIGWFTFYTLSKITVVFIGNLNFMFLAVMFKFIAILSLPIALATEILLLLLKGEEEQR